MFPCREVGFSAAGFSLVGLIGVLAVIAVIATLSAPSFIKQADQAAWTQETHELQAISNALVMSILRSNTIPDLASVPQCIAGELGQPLSRITTTSRGLARSFLYNPNGWLGSTTLPYVQSSSGLSAPPANVNVMVLSTIAEPLPASLGDFNTLWTTAEGAKPSTWSWDGKGDDLRIQRINLGSLFHKILLINADRNVTAPYSIELGSTNLIAANGQAQAWFLHGTMIRFYYNNASGNITNQSRELLLRDSSFTFNNGRWSRDLTAPRDVTGDFAWWVEQFLKPPPPSDPAFAATQMAVVQMMYYYLWGYASWAGVPPGPALFNNTDPNYPPYAALVSTPNGYLPAFNGFTDNLIK